MQVAIKKGNNVVRVVSTYRVQSDSPQSARDIIRQHLENEKLPKGIKLIGKIETLGLKGIL